MHFSTAFPAHEIERFVPRGEKRDVSNKHTRSSRYRFTRTKYNVERVSRSRKSPDQWRELTGKFKVDAG